MDANGLWTLDEPTINLTPFLSACRSPGLLVHAVKMLQVDRAVVALADHSLFHVARRTRLAGYLVTVPLARLRVLRCALPSLAVNAGLHRSGGSGAWQTRSDVTLLRP